MTTKEPTPQREPSKLEELIRPFIPSFLYHKLYEHISIQQTKIKELTEKVEIYEDAIKWKFKRLQTVQGFPLMHKPMCQPNNSTLCSCGLDRWKCDMQQPQHQRIKELTSE